MNVQFRNAKYDEAGTITCEIEHPQFGWIPFTADANDVEAFGRDMFAHIQATGPVAPYLPE